MLTTLRSRLYFWASATLLFTACGADSAPGAGSLSVLLEAESTIIDGLQAGENIENIQDGWSLTYDKFIVAIGELDMRFSTRQSHTASDPHVYAVDLVQVPASGQPLWQLEDLDEGRWDFRFTTPAADNQSRRDDSVTAKDYATMIDAGWTYLIEGKLTNPDGQSCPPASLATPEGRIPNANQSGDNPCYDATTVRFSLGAKAITTFGPCEIDGVPGVAIAADGSQTVAITIHGDHLFFNGFPEGGESGVTRLAQWLADCDLNLDGTVTIEELKAIAPSALPELDDRYQLGGSPITPLATMYDYVRGQLKTQGHFQGEGECPVE